MGAHIFLLSHFFPLANALSRVTAKGRMLSGFKPFNPPEDTHYYSDGDTVQVGSLSFSVVETPGHTPGSVSLVCGDALFSGDTLFRLSCGRTDFPGGDMNAELRSLRKLADLPGDYDVYPGHDMASRLSVERANNPYMSYAIEKL